MAFCQETWMTSVNFGVFIKRRQTQSLFLSQVKVCAKFLWLWKLPYFCSRSQCLSNSMHVNVKLETDAVQYPSDRHLRLCLTFHSLVSFQAFLGLVPPVPHSQSSSMPSPVFQYPTSLDLLLYLWPVLPQGKLPHLSSLHLLSSQSSANVCLLRGHLHAWPTLRSRLSSARPAGLSWLSWLVASFCQFHSRYQDTVPNPFVLY